MRLSLTQVRWRLVLPITMFYTSAWLLVLAGAQHWVWRGSDSPGTVPAETINFLLNGPGFLFPFPLPVWGEVREFIAITGANRLVGVLLFWYLVGRSIDNRGAKKRFTRRRLAVIGFAILSVLCGSLAGLIFDYFFRFQILTWREVNKSYLLYSREVMVLGAGIWLLGFCIYFARKTWLAAVLPKASEQ